jgi:hypothetical protein
MPIYVQDPEIAAATLVEELGAIIADIYNGIEIRLQQDLARRIRRAMDVYPELPERLRAITELQQLAADQIARYAPPQLAEELIRLAAEAGSAAAVARLALAPRLPRSLGLTPTSVNAAAMLALDLRNRFEDVNRRILRYPDDAYKEIVARLAPDMLVGGQSLALTQRRIIQNFLREGVTGFVDVSGRRWRIGSYTEMATRTATMRAWQDAGLARMGASGITLVDVVVGRTACKHCAPWAGRVLSTGGHTGWVEVEHATEDRTVRVFVHATVDQARATHFQHPNCRCILVAHLPGLSVPQDATTWDPEASKAQERQRLLERRVRAAKRDAALAGDPAELANAKADIREAQATIREHIAETGLLRRNYREQLHFADGGTVNPRG